MNGRSNRQQ